jgi:hypothetical protein
MQKFEEINVDVLKECVEELNDWLAAEEVDGIDLIRTTGVEDKDLFKGFVKAVKAVAEAKRGDEMPEKVITFANAVFTGGKEKKEKKPKKPKKPKPPARELNRYGHVLGTQAAALDEAFFEGATYEDAAKAAGVKPGRARHHLNHLKKDKGLTVNEKPEGFFKVKEKELPKAS